MLEENEQLLRLQAAGLQWSAAKLAEYYKSEDDLGEGAKNVETPEGWKRCGKCGHVLKYALFNKNAASKTCTSGSCKVCQRQAASNSYKATKKRRNYKKYYQDNKEMKQKHARQYYQDNKDVINAKHKEYLQTKDGKKVMQKAHKKRRTSMAANKGVPYTRQDVIERDSTFIGENKPICYICNRPIVDISGGNLHIDHLVPIVAGGLDCFTNVACTDKLCNLTREKDGRDLTTESIRMIKERSEAYIEANPERFNV